MAVAVLEAPEVAGASQSFEELFTRYIDRLRLRGRRESTLQEYERDGRRHFLPLLGERRIEEIQPALLEELLATWIEAGLAPHTVHRLYKQLRATLAWAEQMEWIGRNPAARVEPPPRGEARHRALTEVEARTLLVAAQGTSLEALLYIALETGARQGELLALRWSDIPPDGRTMSIDRSVRQLGRGRTVISAPKTRQSRRVVHLSQQAAEVLKAHQRATRGGTQVDVEVREHLVFPSAEGTYLDPSNLRRAFQRIVRKAGLTDLRFHDLRHTAASLMEQAGIPIGAIAAQLGHSSGSFTYSTYVHAHDEARSRAAQTLSSLLRGQSDATEDRPASSG